MTDGDRREIAHIVSTILEARLKDLETNIAAGIAEMLNQFEQILAQRTGTVADLVAAERKKAMKAERQNYEPWKP